MTPRRVFERAEAVFPWRGRALSCALLAALTVPQLGTSSTARKPWCRPLAEREQRRGVRKRFAPRTPVKASSCLRRERAGRARLRA
jgi:hypothetical protein